RPCQRPPRPFTSSVTPCARPQQRHAQLVDLLEELFEAVVFGEPCADLGEQLLGDVDRARLAVFLEGEVLALVPWAAVVAAALGPATAVGVGPNDAARTGA